MLRNIEWTLFLYLVIKICHLLFGPAARPTDAPLRARLRSAEPMLMMAIFGCSGLFTVYSTWWGHRFASEWYTYSTGCYAKLGGAHHLPAAGHKFGSYEAGNLSDNLHFSARLHGSKLGIAARAIENKLDHDRLAYSTYYARIAVRNDRRAIAASAADLDRCMTGVEAPRGNLLRP